LDKNRISEAFSDDSDKSSESILNVFFQLNMSDVRSTCAREGEGNSIHQVFHMLFSVEFKYLLYHVNLTKSVLYLTVSNVVKNVFNIIKETNMEQF
jgi:hypothetical protein